MPPPARRWLAGWLLAGCAAHPQMPTDPPAVDLGVGLEADTIWPGPAYVPGPGELVFEDVTAGTRFNLVGQAFAGPGAERGQQLEVLPAITGFWFAWSTHHPGARIWRRGINHPDVSVEGACGVPCDEIVLACSGIDCIPSIDDPRWVPSGGLGLGYLTDDDRVLGLARNGLARAYPLDSLWTHEVVNDTWGVWAFTVTYCPLTATGVLADGHQGELDLRFGVSGNLWNSNLVLYDRTTRSLWGQLRAEAFVGPRFGASLVTAGLIDTTWGRWRQMFPDTEVLDDTYAADYPYGDYRDDQRDTFAVTVPPPDPRYPNKAYAVGLNRGEETVIWAFPELHRAVGTAGVVQDMVGDLPVLVAYEAAGPTAVVFSRRVDGETRSFVAVP